MLGTSLGVGFPPPSEAGLLPLDPAFAIRGELPASSVRKA
jgi:hypothetical protein